MADTIVISRHNKEFTFPKDVRYFHFRNTRKEMVQIDANSNLFVQEEVTIATGGTTACYYIDHEKQEICYAFAFCNSNDIFNAQAGADIALVRLSDEIVISEDVSSIVGRITLDTCKQFVINEVLNVRSQVVCNFYKEKYIDVMKKAADDAEDLLLSSIENFIDNTMCMELLSISVIRQMIEIRKDAAFKKYRSKKVASIKPKKPKKVATKKVPNVISVKKMSGK